MLTAIDRLLVMAKLIGFALSRRFSDSEPNFIMTAAQLQLLQARVCLGEEY
jgi:hypothetical protein